MTDPVARSVPMVVAALEGNHNGDLSLARRMVDVAVDCRCQAIKLPVGSLRVESPDEASSKHPELSEQDVERLREYCEGRIAFIAAPADLSSLGLLQRLRVDAYQVDPAVVCHEPLLAGLATEGKEVLLAAGMCSDPELARALRTLDAVPLTILHCVAAPAPTLAQTALGRIPYLRDVYGLRVGYLGFEAGILASLAAMAVGAVTIEKPFTVDHHLQGNGHSQSLDREELRLLVESLRALATSLAPCDAQRLLSVELSTAAEERCTLVAARPLPAGTILEPDMIEVRNTPGGLSPQLGSWLVGRRLIYEMPTGSPITFGVVEQ